MTNGQETSESLIVLAADSNAEQAVRGILSRHRSLRIRPVVCDVFVHPESDPGCLLRSHDYLRSFHLQYRYAMVLMDREGCGQDDKTRDVLEDEIETRLRSSGWSNRCAAVVVDPELEAWVWSDSPEVDHVLGWGGRTPNLRAYLTDIGYLVAGQSKPARPKETLEHILRECGTPRSAAIYRELAERVSIHRCTDSAFVKLRTVLKSWFGT